MPKNQGRTAVAAVALLAVGLGLYTAACSSDSSTTGASSKTDSGTTTDASAKDSGGGTLDSGSSDSGSTRKASATISSTGAIDAGVSGKAEFEETADGVSVKVTLDKAPQGIHGIHVHTTGDCGNAGNDAGSHFNPADAGHGIPGTDTLTHGGDFGNITVGDGGTGSLSLTAKGINLKSGDPNTILNRAVILHESPDQGSGAKLPDGGPSPTGNAGSRIGCGVIN